MARGARITYAIIVIAMFFNKCFRAVITGVFLMTSYGHTQAQLEKRYVPLRAYNEDDHELMDFLIGQIESEFTYTSSSYAIEEINEHRVRFLLKAVKSKQFIRNDTLENYTAGVMRTLLEHNTLRDHPRRVLVSKSPYVNASCYGRGIYIVTVPLLARVYTEDELAFTIAHEMATMNWSICKRRLFKPPGSTSPRIHGSR